MAAEGQRKIEIGDQIQNYIAHALFAGKRESPGVKPPKQNGAGTQSECLENVGTAANAPIKQHGNPSIHFAHDGGESVERGEGSVDLPATVIRDNHAIGTSIERVGCVLRMQYPLQKYGKRCVLAKERNIAPGERGIGKKATPKLNRCSRILLRWLCKKGAKNGIAEIVAETLAKYKRQIGMLKIAFPPSQHVRIESDH